MQASTYFTNGTYFKRAFENSGAYEMLQEDIWTIFHLSFTLFCVFRVVGWSDNRLFTVNVSVNYMLSNVVYTFALGIHFRRVQNCLRILLL